MDKDKRDKFIAVKVTPAEKQELYDYLSRHSVFQSLSHLIRYALTELFKKDNTK